MRVAPLLLLALCIASPAFASDAYRTRAIVMPGSGYLVADGTSVVVLEVIIDVKKGYPPPKRADISAERGEVLATKVSGAGRVQVFYKMPAKKYAGRIGLTIKLQDPAGGEVEESFSMTIEEPKAPAVEIAVTPDVIDARTPTSVKVAVGARGQDLEGLGLAGDRSDLVIGETRGDTNVLYQETSMAVKGLPIDAPSYLLVLGAASSKRGYSGAAGGVSAKAPVRISVEIPPGTELVVDGAESEMAPVPAPADGKTVMENVEVRYGARLRAFQKRGRTKSELSVVIPTGQVSAGLAVGIPGQTSADSGVGASILVAIPPSPIGAKPFWPDITVEGATLLSTEQVSDRVKALIIKRPGEPKNVRVTMDEQVVGTIAFDAGRGASIDVKAAKSEAGERAAALITVRDGGGTVTDFPAPKVRLDPVGIEPELTHVGTGKYRVGVPSTGAGANGAQLQVIAEIPSPPLVAGDPLDPITDRVALKLEGPGGAIKTGPAPPPRDVPPPPPPRDGQVVPPPPPPPPQPPPPEHVQKHSLGIAAYGVFGRSFSSLLMFGVGVGADFRPPLLEGRLSIRGGAEFVSGSASGQVTLDGSNQTDSSATIAGMLIPIEIGFAVLASDDFELLGKAGAALRFEQGALDVGGNSAGGGSRVGFGLRAGLEGDLHFEAGTLIAAAVLDGLAASAKGLGPANGFDDSLLNVRAEVGFRWWF